MLINRKTPAVAALLVEWETAQRTKESSELFKFRLTMDILKPALRPFAGQLMLFSHKFLTMVPTGAHSFAHGTEMRSKDIHWLTAGRITSAHPFSILSTLSQGILYVAQQPGKKSEPVIGPTGGQDYFIPVQWLWHTQMRYRRSTNHPHFIMHEQGPLYEPEQSYIPVSAIDISAFGDHLFRRRHKEHDWATDISLIIGTRSVKAYLAENKSLAAFNRIARL